MKGGKDALNQYTRRALGRQPPHTYEVLNTRLLKNMVDKIFITGFDNSGHRYDWAVQIPITNFVIFYDMIQLKVLCMEYDSVIQKKTMAQDKIAIRLSLGLL